MGSKEKHKARRILFVHTTLDKGGGERVLTKLINRIVQSEHTAILALLRRKGSYLEALPTDLPVYELSSRSLWYAVSAIRRVINETRPDVLFVMGAVAIPSIIATRLAGVDLRIVVSERNRLFHTKATVKRWLLVGLKRFLFKYADEFIAVSQGVKDEMVKYLGLSPRSVKVLYNPVVDESILALSKEPVEHPWFEMPCPVILGAGRFVEQKDFSTLIRAFAKVRETQDARLVIIGEGPLRPHLEELASTLGVAEDVWMPGFEQNPFKYMARASLFVLSSLHEGLPGVLIQTMACETAVIATDCPHGPREIIEDGVTGFLVPVGDVDLIAQRINYLISHENSRSEIAHRGYVSVQRFESETVAAKYEAVLVGCPISLGTLAAVQEKEIPGQ